MYKPRKIHEYDFYGYACNRCGITQKEITDKGLACLTDAELEDRDEWRKAAEAAGELMRRKDEN